MFILKLEIIIFSSNKIRKTISFIYLGHKIKIMIRFLERIAIWNFFSVIESMSN